jgi:hypothetical protein
MNNVKGKYEIEIMLKPKKFGGFIASKRRRAHLSSTLKKRLLLWVVDTLFENQDLR